MKRIAFFLAALIMTVSPSALFSKDYTLTSPDKKITVTVSVDQYISYTVAKNGVTLLNPSSVAMILSSGKIIGESATVRSAKTTFTSETVPTPFYRQAYVKDEYNELTIRFREGFSLIWRAYDSGVAYRFHTYYKDTLSIKDEISTFNFPGDPLSYIPYSPNTENPFQTSFENRYTVAPVSQIEKGRPAFLPILIAPEEGPRILITESDLEDYPGMFLRGCGCDNFICLRSTFAGIPSEIYVHPTRCQQIAKAHSDTIAVTAGTRPFPWRIMAIADSETELPSNDLVWLLGSPSRIDDISWIRPGKVAWDWWNDWGITGVDFKAGINTQTYKYFIDFASANGLEYIILDEGWSKPSAGDIMSVIPEIDLPELISYGRSKNVDIILWAVAFVLDDKLEEACRTYSEMGIKGFKVDFMDRDDQEVVALNYRILDMATRYHLLIDYHGMYKPTGLNRTYPNLINYEGVWGLEQMKWSDEDQVTYNVTFPYIRMAAGPVDFTQGAMENAALKRNFKAIYSHPMSQGTRSHQVATYIVFDSPLVMLADSPTAYMKEQETTDFIKDIPTVWDETRIIDGRIGKYIVTARRSGSHWYIGCLNGLEERDITIDLSQFPGITPETSLEIFRDGANSHRLGTDYRLETLPTPQAGHITLHLAPGGGFAVKIR